MLSLSYKEALSALCFGIATDAQKNTLAFRDLGIYTTLLQGRNRQDINAFILRVNLLIEQHDKKYKSVDGVVYNTAGTTLIYYPRGRDESFVIPTGVTTIATRAKIGWFFA